MPHRAEVERWLATYENPMKDVVLRLREIVLGADSRMDECIKWQAPTFTFEGNLASYYPKSKQHASLMFHVGAQIPGKHPLLEGSGDTSRVLKIGSVAEANAKKKDIEAIVHAWCAWKSGGKAPAKKGPAAKAPAKKAAAKPAAETTKKPAARKSAAKKAPRR